MGTYCSRGAAPCLRPLHLSLPAHMWWWPLARLPSAAPAEILASCRTCWQFYSQTLHCRRLPLTLQLPPPSSASRTQQTLNPKSCPQRTVQAAESPKAYTILPVVAAMSLLLPPLRRASCTQRICSTPAPCQSCLQSATPTPTHCRWWLPVAPQLPPPCSASWTQCSASCVQRSCRSRTWTGSCMGPWRTCRSSGGLPSCRRGSRLTWRSIWSRHRCAQEGQGVPRQCKGHQASLLFQRRIAVDLGCQAGRVCRGWYGMLSETCGDRQAALRLTVQ